MGCAVGQMASFSKTITETDVYGFAGITGDFNPLHVDAVTAEAGRFGERIAHGMLSASFISTVIATRLPGPGTIYMGQEVRFLNPVRFGDTITATVVIEELLDRGRVRLHTFVENQKGETVVDGYALVKLPRKEGEGENG